jgi:hypothetical protein
MCGNSAFSFACRVRKDKMEKKKQATLGERKTRISLMPPDIID